MIEKLQNLGLTKREAEAYMALYNFRETTATHLSKLTKEHRVNLYDSLTGLIKKGLVSYNIKGGVKFFSVSDPQKLVDFIKEKEELAKNIVPALESKREKITDRPVVEVYDGENGFKSLLSKLVRESKPIFAIGASEEWEKRFPHQFEHYLKLRKHKNIPAKLLYVGSANPKMTKTSINEIRLLPLEFSGPTTIVLFGDYVAIFMWTTPLIATLTKSSELYKSFKDYFKLLWSISKPLTKK